MLTKKLEALYEEKFRALNAEFKQIATDWQMRRLPGGRHMLNDHTDLDYDFDVLDRLSALNERLDSIKREVLSILPECRGYFDGLQKAMEKIDGGDYRFFTSPDVDSYHNVWFEMHDYILKKMGIERREDEV